MLVRKVAASLVGIPDPDATRSSLIQRLHNWSDHGSWQDFFDT